VDALLFLLKLIGASKKWESKSDGITYLFLSVTIQITMGGINEEIAHIQISGVRVCKEMATSINN